MRHKSEELMQQILNYAEKFLLLNHRSPYTSEIADALGLSENTIKTYNFRLYKKLEVESRVQAVNKIREEIINL